jgi:hypothetical protein
MIGYRALGMVNRRLATAYAARVNHLLTHVNIWPPSRWVDLTEASGLRVERMQHLLSPSATACYELLLPLALASRAWRVAFGRRPPHPAALRRLVAGPMRSLITQPSRRGSNILIVAKKP